MIGNPVLPHDSVEAPHRVRTVIHCSYAAVRLDQAVASLYHVSLPGLMVLLVVARVGIGHAVLKGVGRVPVVGVRVGADDVAVAEVLCQAR